MRSLLTGATSLALIAAGIPAHAQAVTSLADGRSGKITFESPTPKTTRDLVTRSVMAHATISGVLTLPQSGAGLVPAMIILHGSGGISGREPTWAQRMNDLGYAAFIVDSFTGRGIKDTVTDQSQLSMASDMADGLVALRLLASHPRIDRKRIAVMGFSRGGIAALYTALEPIRRGIIDDDLRFAAHVPLYPGCNVPYVSAHLDGAPILMLLGGKDDYTPAPPCVAYAETLRAKGAEVSVVVYPEARHGFDGLSSPRYFPAFTTGRDCRGAVDVDTGAVTAMTKNGAVEGEAAAAELKQCVTRGVYVGGDMEGREKAPVAVADFLKKVFAAIR
ncbi:MAG TPA: dienelactone hydrolase family protein [Stellaceae bacterium]|nr:dienelactone hydrolase family protein [Stellaceae bacterium]